MSTTERLNIPNTINWLNAVELRDIARELGFLSAENATLLADAQTYQHAREALALENAELATQLATRDAEIATLRAQVGMIHHAIKDAGWHPGRTDDLLTDIIRSKGKELAGMRAQVEALHLRLMTAEDGAKEAARAEEIYVKAERLLTADERSLHDEVVKLRAQVEALQKAAEHLPWIGHGADWTEAKPVYLVATGEVNEGQETCTRHDAPVPLADQEVLFTRPPEPLVRPAVTRDQIREVFMRCGFTIKEGQTDLKQYVYDAAYALLASAPQPPVEVGDWQDTLYLLRRLISNQHTFTGPEFRAELTKIVGEVVAAAPQPEAQKGGA